MGPAETTVPPLLPQIQNDASEKDSGTETADNNDSVPAATFLDPSVVYKDEEETVLDTYDPAYVNTV